MSGEMSDTELDRRMEERLEARYEDRENTMFDEWFSDNKDEMIEAFLDDNDTKFKDFCLEQFENDRQFERDRTANFKAR